MKSKNDVAGYRYECFYYEPCPLCYGCRNYHGSYKCDNLCAHTAQDRKNNICNKPELHNPTNFAKMIRRPEPILLD